MRVVGKKEQDATEKGQEGVRPEPCKEMIVRHGIDRPRHDHQEREQQGVGADADLQFSVEGEESLPLRCAVDALARKIASQGQAPHEDRQDRGHGERGASQNLIDQPDPQDFIDKARKTREKETGKDRWGEIHDACPSVRMKFSKRRS